MIKLIHFFKKFDAFGSGINFTVNGGDKFNTSFGTLLTFLIYVLVTIYAQMKLSKLYYRHDTIHQTSMHEDVIKQDEIFSLKDLEANFAFSLWPNDFSSPLNLTMVSDYVQFEAKLESFDFTNGTL